MNMKMKKYRYIISAVAEVASVFFIVSVCTSGKESNASSVPPGLSTSAQQRSGCSSGVICVPASYDINSTYTYICLTVPSSTAYSH